MPKKSRDSSEESSSGDSDDSRSSSPSPARRSRSPAKKKSSKISSSKHHSRKSRKSYKHRDDKKKKRRRSSSSSRHSDSRSRSASSRSDSRSRRKSKRPSSKSREREKEREQKKKQQAPPPEKKPAVPALSEEEQKREKERIKQIRRAKLLSMKYTQDEDAPAKESPVLTAAPQEKMEEFPTERLDNGFGLMDELEGDDDEEKSVKEHATPTMKAQTAEMEEEIDPLDAYMNGIDQVAKQQVLEVLNKDMEENGYPEAKVDKSHVITAEELENLYRQPETTIVANKSFQHKAFAEDEAYGNANNGHMEEEQEDDDEFYKAFIKAMKKKDTTKKPPEPVKEQKEEEKKKKSHKHDKGEILDDDNEDDYMAFREGNESDTDYVARQKKQAEKKELKPTDADIEYEPFRKNFFIESKEIADMTPEEVAEYRKDLGDIQVRGKDCPRPIKNWYQMGLSDAVLELITEKKKFANPFPIQCQASPAIMSGRDVIGVAETGSGKTLAYVLPMLRHIKDQRPLAEGDGPIGLIMAPTRELAWQIYIECRAFARVVGLNVACVYGGAGVQGQIADLKRGAEIVVCTPGRMIDVLSTSNGKITNLRRVTFVVLDEADRMLDFGFEPQIGRILGNVRPDRQTAMFSATFPRNVENLAKKVLTRPIEIIVGSRGKTSSNIDQIIEVVDEDNKFLKLLKILGEWSEKGSVLIFVNKQTDADNLFKELLKYSYAPLVLHGGQDPDDRENTISDFKKGVRTLMVATSVCARGLDIKSLVLVVNYQCPHHKEDYIHRIGRTGRAGNKGTAVTFITKEEDQYAYDIITALKMSNIEPPQDLLDLAEGYKDQVEKGERKHYLNRNLAGTGFKFDKTEKDKVKDTKRALKRQFGLELNMSDVDSDEDIITSKETKDEKGEVDEAHIKKMLKDPNTRTAVTRAAEKAAKDAILAGSSSEEVLTAAHNAIRSILSQYRGSGLDRVVELVGEIEEREDENNERFSADLEINDYPQGARNKVCHRDFLGMIHDLTNCNVTIRGTYFEPGKKVPANQKKLRLHVVGESKHEVENAYREIRRILEETAAYSMNTVGGQSGKFTL